MEVGRQSTVRLLYQHPCMGLKGKMKRGPITAYPQKAFFRHLPLSRTWHLECRKSTRRPQIQRQMQIQIRRYGKIQKHGHKGDRRRRRPPPLWGQPKAALTFLYIFRLSGSGFVFAFVFVSVGVGLTCGIPKCQVLERDHMSKKCFFSDLHPLFVLGFKLYGFMLV